MAFAHYRFADMNCTACGTGIADVGEWTRDIEDVACAECLRVALFASQARTARLRAALLLTAQNVSTLNAARVDSGVVTFDAWMREIEAALEVTP